MSDLRSCSIPDCGKPAKYKKTGWCSMHYMRLRTHGDPLKTIGTSIGEPKRFYREVIIQHEDDDCLTWPFSRNRSGYAKMWRDGKMELVHRFLCAEINGLPPTPKHEAAHSCGNGHLGCVTKRHLSWKTRKENQADRLAHGTHSRGERSCRAKLTDEQAREILSLKGRVSSQELSRRFGVKSNTISQIHTGKTWGWLSEGERP